MNNPIKILLGAVLFLILGIAGNMDYRDAVLAEQHYATMICDGHWPDYKELKPECDRSEQEKNNNPETIARRVQGAGY
tara:strand:+ start:483 stop:716 length:234 start_codon:yes stop_codon:yes gene_type:complete